jgi:hypothetical protein
MTISLLNHAQITGIVNDEYNNNKINLASVNLIQPSDSTLVASTRSNTKGEFKIGKLSDGNYELLITHPTFADKRITVVILNGKTDLGMINMKPRSKMIEEIFVKQKGSIKFKGDTTQFIADSFKVDVNASVEDLLKVLPGLEVDKDGNITAQGEQVQKILVDGEEFFGDDPTVATRNLQANIVDKVEVFDDKTEQAKFTGFDDGQKEKTINLKLKKDKNRGVFGKVQGGTDATNYYDNSLMLNAFKQKRKLSIYGINSNTGTQGLSWRDKSNFGDSGGGRMMDEDDPGIMYYTRDEDEGGGNGRNGTNYNGVGLPIANNIGIHYSNKWLENKHHLNINANLRDNQLDNINQDKTTQFFGPITLVNNKDVITDNRTKNLNANVRYEVAVDSNNSLVIKMNGRQNNTISKTDNYATIINGADTSSTTNNKSTSDAKNNRYGGDITWRHKTAKKGRTVSVNLSNSTTDNSSTGSLNGSTVLKGIYTLLDQQKNSNSDVNNNSGRITYTEPLKKDELLMELSYGLGLNNSLQQKNTYTVGVSNKYDQRIDSLSNDFNSNIVSHSPGIKFRINKKKMNYGVGAILKRAHYQQQDIIRDIRYDYTRYNIIPSANLMYRKSQFNNLRMNYSGSTNQPSIQYLQPFVNNSNPINIIIGNPNLVQSYDHNVNVNWWSYKALSDRSVWAGAWASQSFNDVVDSTSYDAATGRQITSYANVNGTYNLSFWSGFNSKIKSSNWKISAGLNLNNNRMPNYTLGKKNFGNNSSINPNFGFNYNKPKKYQWEIKTEPTYNIYTNKILAQGNKFWSHTLSSSGLIYITKKMVLRSDVDYNWQQARPPFNDNFNRVIWNGAINYRLLKQNNLEGYIKMNDILNQNVNYNRNNSANFINETRNSTIQRVLLVGAIYNFSLGPMSRMKDLVDDEENF